MRTLKVHHVTRYDYAQPMRSVVQSLRLRPRMNDAQDVISWNIETSDGFFGGVFTDGAGDRLTTLSVKGPVESISITATGRVETEDTAGILKGHRERINPLAYLSPTRQTEPDDAIRDLAEASEGIADPIDLAHDLSRSIAEHVSYQAGETHSATTAAEALAAGKGVCQDQTQVMLAAARHLGLPARYVSGYLLTDRQGFAHDATHAWAEIHVGSLGWVGFDVTNHCCPDDRYIRVGSGADASDAAPVRGVAFGGGEQDLAVEVSVTEVS